MKTFAKGLVASAAAVAIALGGAACSNNTASSGGSGDAKTDESAKELTVRFGYIQDLNGTALLAVAEKEGLWKKYNLKPELRTFTNGPLQIQALNTKDLDYGYIGNGAFWLPASGKADLASLIAVSQADRVIAQPGIKSIQDLKGKKVGVPEGTSGDTILSLALEKAGMTVNDIQRVPMDPATITSAFSNGQIDGAGLWYPLIATIKEKVPNLEELAQDSDFEDKMAFPSAIVMRKGLDKENAELAKRVEKVLYEALEYRAANPDKVVEMVAEMSGQPVEKLKGEGQYIKPLSAADQVKLAKDGTIEKWLDAMGKFFVAKGKVKEGELLPPKDYFRADLLEAAGK